MRKKISLFNLDVEVQIGVSKRANKRQAPVHTAAASDIKLNFGPGPNWVKPDDSWYSIDIDPAIGDVVVNFQEFAGLPFEDASVSCVYGSHVFEHISIFNARPVFKEIYRVLNKGGIFRLVLPDAEKSISEYVRGNAGFLLFSRRRERAKKQYGIEYTLFECLREDFLSPSGQTSLLGKNMLAHQNAWDFTTIKADLERAGFDAEHIFRSGFRQSRSEHFSFEGTFPSEANEDYRSLYVEAVK